MNQRPAPSLVSYITYQSFKLRAPSNIYLQAYFEEDIISSSSHRRNPKIRVDEQDVEDSYTCNHLHVWFDSSPSSHKKPFSFSSLSSKPLSARPRLCLVWSSWRGLNRSSATHIACIGIAASCHERSAERAVLNAEEGSMVISLTAVYISLHLGWEKRRANLCQCALWNHLMRGGPPYSHHFLHLSLDRKGIR